MASAARNFTRSAWRAAPSTLKYNTTTRATLPILRETFRQQSRRGYASGPPPGFPTNPNHKPGQFRNWAITVGAFLAVGTIYGWRPDLFTFGSQEFTPTFEDYQKVYDMIAKRLEELDDYDDGSYGPVLVRLAWHASGTYDKETGTGGSNGATMRFAPEGDHGANSGLKMARDFLEPVKLRFPWLSYGDLWTLGAVCAVQEMQGPVVPWRPGRQDRDVSFCTPDGRLPDASKEQDHIRGIFYRMGFNDQEIVALAGAHALGRCHTDRSGFDGPWTFSPTTLTNEYYKLLLQEKWNWKKWNGPKQYEDTKTKTLMMLPADMAFVKDKTFKQWVDKYAQDSDLFFKDFSDVIVKLFELGVPFSTSEGDRYKFKSSFQ